MKLVKVTIGREFTERVIKDIIRPHFHRPGLPGEVCGAMDIVLKEPGHYVLVHDGNSVVKTQANDHGFQTGAVDNGVQFCQPRKYVSNILWHTHPVGVAAYPSGSDVFVAMINDCSKTFHHMDGSAQAYLEFLFTEPGFWVIHRRVMDDDSLAPALEVSDMDSEIIASMTSRLEKRIINEYYRTPVPDDLALGNIREAIEQLDYTRQRVEVAFYRWTDRDVELQLPQTLFEQKVGKTCLRC